MGKLISKFFQIRRVLKLCPFLMLTLLLMLSIIFIAGDRYGYKFYPNDEQKLAMIIIGITVVLSLISILSMTIRASIKTYSSSVLPLFALAFSFCVYLGTNITKDTFLLMCGAVTGCSFFVCVFCGRKGFIKQLIILITIIAVAGIGFLKYSNKEIIIDKINISKVEYLVVSADNKTQVSVIKNSNGEYSVYSNDTARNIDAFIGEMKKVRSNLICNSDTKPQVDFKSEDILIVNSKEYEIKRG